MYALLHLLAASQPMSLMLCDGTGLLEAPRGFLDKGSLPLRSLQVTLPDEGGRTADLLPAILRGSMQALKEVQITFSNSTPPTEHDVLGNALHRRNPQVTSLQVTLPSPMHAHVLSAYVPFLNACDGLTSLTLACQQPGVPSLEACDTLCRLLHAKSAGSLRELSLTNWTKDRAGALSIAELFLTAAAMPNLVKLDLRGNNGFCDRENRTNPELQELFRRLGANTSLKCLDLHGPALESTDTLYQCESLARLLKDNNTLEHLTLPDLSNDFDIEALYKAVMSNTSLRHLVANCYPRATNNGLLYMKMLRVIPLDRANLHEKLFHAQVSLLSGDTLPDELIRHVHDMGLDLMSGAHLAVLNRAARDRAAEAHRQWEQEQQRRKADLH